MPQSPDAPSRKLRIVIPAYNEETRIGPTLVDYCTEFRDLATIAVVAAGCTDATADVVRQLQSSLPNLHLIEVGRALGKGGAVRLGFTEGDEEFVAFVDADGATSAREMSRLFDRLRTSEDDVLVASRWLRGSHVEPRQKWTRRVASRAFNVIVRALFGLRIKDTQCGAKVFRRSAVRRVFDRLELADLAFDIELLLRLSNCGLRIVEVPTTWSDHPDGSKIRLGQSSLAMLKSVVRLRLRDSILWRIPLTKHLAAGSVVLVRDLPSGRAGYAKASGHTDSPLSEAMVSVIMPAFNESELIARNLREVVETFAAFDASFEVILVDDGSHDDTYLHALAVLGEHPERVRVLRYDVNRGKGNALMAGTRAARGQYVIFLDSDMDIHPSQLPVFFDIMRRTNASAVIGSKRHPRSKVRYPLVRQIYSTGYYALVRLLFGLPLRDTQTGLKLFRTELLRDVLPRVLAKRFAFDIELLSIAHHLGYKICDAPVVLGFNRRYGRINYREAWRIFLDTLAIFYRLRILRYYDTKHDVGAFDPKPVREMSREDALSLTGAPK